MDKIKKIPQAVSLAASIIIIFVSIIGNANLNILAYRVIIISLVFYFIGFLIRYFIESTYKPEVCENIEENECDQLRDNEEEISKNEEFIPLNGHNIDSAEEK